MEERTNLNILPENPKKVGCKEYLYGNGKVQNTAPAYICVS